MAQIEIKGLPELFRKLGAIEKIQDVLEPPMQRAVLRVQARMAKYPPPPAKSRYVRTGTLGRRWTTRVDRTVAGVIGKVGNNTIYGPFVQSKQFQAKVHQGRWTNTDEQVLSEELPTITADFNRAVDEALK